MGLVVGMNSAATSLLSMERTSLITYQQDYVCSVSHQAELFALDISSVWHKQTDCSLYLSGIQSCTVFVVRILLSPGGLFHWHLFLCLNV
jgi:hypothetical protein